MAAADADHAHRSRLRVHHRIPEWLRHVAQRRDRHETEIAAALCRLGVFREIGRELREGRAGLEPFHQHLRLGLCFLRRAGVVARAVDLLVGARGRHRDLRDVIRVFGAIERRAIGFKEVLDVFVGDGDLRDHLALHHLVGQHVAAQAVAHVGRRQAAARELLLELILGDVFLRVGVGVVELGVGELDFQLARLGQQQLLDDHLVQQRQLAAQRFFLRGLLRSGLAAVRLFDLVARDLAFADGGPHVRRCRRRRAWAGGVRAASPGRDRHAQRHQERKTRSSHPVIVTLPGGSRHVAVEHPRSARQVPAAGCRSISLRRCGRF